LNNKAKTNFFAVTANQQSEQRNNGERQNKVQNAGHMCSEYEAGLIFLHILCNEKQ